MCNNTAINLNPLVTVITVTYNSSKYVRSAIESILASSYTNFELIIGDDASSDNTWEIVQKYKDTRIVAYRNESNLGEYPNRVKAIHQAKGEYLIFIDGDDMIYPHGLEYVTTAITKYPDSGMLLMYPYLNWVFYPIKISPKEFYLSNFFSKGFNDIAFANTLFKTKLVKQFSLLLIKFKAGDIYIRLKIASRYDTVIVQDQFTWWRETPGQASRKISSNPLSIIENYNLHSEIILSDDCPLSEIEKEEAIANELYKIKMVWLNCLKKLAIGDLFVLLKYVLSRKIVNQILFAKRKYHNPFSQYNSSNPLRMDISKSN